jgi:hypothetical protein
MTPTQRRVGLGVICALTLAGCATSISGTDAGCRFWGANEHLTQPSRHDTAETIDNLVIYREGMEAACP